MGTAGQALNQVSGASAAAAGRRIAAAWWRRSGNFPSLVKRQYWSVAELEHDRQAMAEMGYEVIDSAPVERLPQEAVLQGRISRYQHRIPVAAVVYERRRRPG